MKKVLLIVESDPHRSARAAEGFRVADGLSLADELAVTVLISGAAAAAFSDPQGHAETWIDSLLLLKHLSVLQQRHVPVHLFDQGRPAFLQSLSLQPTNAEAVAEMRREAGVVIEF